MGEQGTGQASIWPRCAASAAVFRGEQVLLIERGKGTLQGFWSLPGGHIEAGETARAAALREVREETGVAAELAGLVDIHEVIRHRARRYLGGPLSDHRVLGALACWRAAGRKRCGRSAVRAACRPPILPPHRRRCRIHPARGTPFHASRPFRPRLTARAGALSARRSGKGRPASTAYSQSARDRLSAPDKLSDEGADSRGAAGGKSAR